MFCMAFLIEGAMLSILDALSLSESDLGKFPKLACCLIPATLLPLH